ncbi:ABC transporter ATP-binding protein [Salinigranum salinum]|uniref:ABC transporter ATP-binding protein n=1 Tax=Salinigranum salinum TaxID=1364937 RepID=UPI001260D1B7|nr:ABC transporter ATP-binding protein [Salinigranum salinum]
MAAITIEKLSKHFPDGGETVVAVDELDLEIDDGDFVVFVGPSGCGKTTTLRCIAGLETVTDGDIHLAGERVTDTPPEDRDIAMVFQSYALYPHMTVRENMGFGLKYATDHGADYIEERIQKAAGMMGIGELLDRKPADLSGGQQQRVALGRAIVRDPKAFLMDEPLSNLDAKLRAEMRTYLQELQEELGTTTVYVTHDQTEAMTMGDKIAILKDGRLQQFGTPAECYHEPSNTFVAEFLGEPSVNLIEMELDDGRITSAYFECETDSSLTTAGGHGEVIVGIRPEAVELSDGDPSAPTEFHAEVNVVEHLGRESNVHVTVSGTSDELTAIVEGRPAFTGGEQVTVRISEAAIHLFDARTGDVLRNATADGTDKIHRTPQQADS